MEIKRCSCHNCQNFQRPSSYEVAFWIGTSVSVVSMILNYLFCSCLGQLPFWRLTKVNATCVIRLPPMCSVYVEKQPVAWEDCCVKYWSERTRKCMSRLTASRDITEKLLKNALNPNQSTIVPDVYITNHKYVFSVVILTVWLR